MNLFVPKMYLPDLFHINYQKLKDLGYQLLIFDLDNTIGSIQEEKCREKTATFINQQRENFIIVIASNSKRKRVESFCSPLKCDFFSFSMKPTLKVLKKIKKKYKVDFDKMVVIGDQIVTDIFVGNRKNLLTILVDPIENIDFKITSFNRKLENFLNKKNKIVRGSYYEKK